MNEPAQSRPSDQANVIMLPPLIFLIPLGTGALLHYLVLELSLLSNHALGHIIGWPLVAIGIGLMLIAVYNLRSSGEDVDVRSPTHAIVERGLYKYSRNPIYLGFIIIYLGLALVLNTWWLLIFLPIAVAVTHYGVILHEEKYLTAKLGQPYQAYLAKVRRWL